MTPEENQRFNREYLMRRGEVNPLLGFFDSLDRALTGRFQRQLPPPKGALPYGHLPASAADTPGFVVGQPVDPTTWPSGGVSDDVNVEDSEYRRMAQQYGDTEMRNAMLNQAGEGVSLADYYGAQRQLGGMVSADEEQGKAMEDYFMTLPGFDSREKAKAFIGQNPGIAFREFNKANPMAMVGNKPAMIEEESITDFMDTGLDRDEAIRRIRGGMTPQTESNLEQTAQGQPVAAQNKNNISDFSLTDFVDYKALNGTPLLSGMAQKVYGNPYLKA